MLRAVSLFSGCGGFDWGAAQAGVDIVMANDIDLHASVAYKGLFPKVNFVDGDVRDIEVFPSADVLIGCYPCTGFSEAARRRWGDRKERNLRDMPSNFLYEEFLRALRQVRPKYLFVENVRGMRTAEEGWFFQQQLNGFQSLGYKVESQLLSASDFGVAQMRKRLFIVGVHRDMGGCGYSFPKPTHGSDGPNRLLTLRDVIYGWPDPEEDEYCTKPFHGHYLTRNRKRGWDDVSYTIVAHAHHVPLHPSGLPMKPAGKDCWILQGDTNRRLSWKECAAIQGLPAKVSPSGSLMQKYRVVGNAVPPALGRALLEQIVKWGPG